MESAIDVLDGRARFLRAQSAKASQRAGVKANQQRAGVDRSPVMTRRAPTPPPAPAAEPRPPRRPPPVPFDPTAPMCARCACAITKQPLTQRQAEVLELVRASIEARGYAPALREIANHFKWRALSTVHEHLGEIERKGHIRVTFNAARGISLCD